MQNSSVQSAMSHYQNLLKANPTEFDDDIKQYLSDQNINFTWNRGFYSDKEFYVVAFYIHDPYKIVIDRQYSRLGKDFLKKKGIIDYFSVDTKNPNWKNRMDAIFNPIHHMFELDMNQAMK